MAINAEIFETLGKVAGIGGLSLGVFLFLLKDVLKKALLSKLGPKHSYQLLRLIVIVVTTVTLVGMTIWLYIEVFHQETPQIVHAVISGTVKSEKGQPLDSATVTIGPFGEQTESGSDGSYSISIALPGIPFPLTSTIVRKNYRTVEKKLTVTKKNLKQDVVMALR